MKITFSCESCQSEFTVDEQLAGRSGRCKKCGTRFIIPNSTATAGKSQGTKPASAAQVRSPAIAGKDTTSKPAVKEDVASPASPRLQGVSAPTKPSSSPDRMPAKISLKPMTEEPLRLAEPRLSKTSPKKAGPQRAAGWLDAVNSQIALKPVSLENLLSVRLDEELRSDSVSYRPVDSEPTRRKPSSRGPGMIKKSYKATFKKTGKILRWINETAYGISILFMILACVGYIMQMTSNTAARVSEKAAAAKSGGTLPSSHERSATSPPPNRYITIGLSGIVVLNLVRLVVGLANLIVIPFRQSPIQGLIFLIPPMMFVYIKQHWNQVRKPVNRIINPAFTLAMVIVAYLLIPGLSRGRDARGDFRDRLHGAVQSLERDVGVHVKEVQSKVRTLEQNLPDKLNQAQQAAEGLQDQAEKVLEKFTVPGKDDAKKPEGAGNPEADKPQ